MHLVIWKIIAHGVAVRHDWPEVSTNLALMVLRWAMEGSWRYSARCCLMCKQYDDAPCNYRSTVTMENKPISPVTPDTTNAAVATTQPPHQTAPIPPAAPIPVPKPVAPPTPKPTAAAVAKPAAAVVAKPAAPVVKKPVAAPVPAITKVAATPVVPFPTPVTDSSVRTDTVLLPRLRARTRSRTLLSFFLLVVLPSVGAGWYYFMVATPMYVSETKMAFKKGDKLINQGTGDILSAVMGNSGLASQDALIVVAYLRSPEAMRDAEAALSLRQHYSMPEADHFSRLNERATQDQFYKYWQSAVYAKMNAEFGLMDLSVRAFTPEMACDLSAFLFGKCEEIINQLNDRMRADSLELAMAEVHRAESKVYDASKGLETFRMTHNVLDLESTTGIRMRVIGELESEIAKTSAEIMAKSSFIAENHVEMRSLRARVEALQSQLEEERGKVASETATQKSIASLAAEYERKVTDLSFARKLHEMAVASLESARIQAATKTTYVIPVVAPVLLDEALYPKPFQSTGLFFLANLIVFGLISMLYASLKDHLGV